MANFTQLHTKAEFELCIKATAGKTILIAYWPEDQASRQVVDALRAQLPADSYAAHDIVDVYCFDVYSLPELGTELDIDFVPTLMWFTDGVMDPVVWHEGVSIEGETVAMGVQRVVDRIKGGQIGGDDSEEEWLNSASKGKKGSQPWEDSDDEW